MRQVLFEIPGTGIRIFGYGVMLVVGLFVGQFVACRAADKYGGDREKILDGSYWIFFAGLFGARLFYVLQKYDQFTNPLLEFIQVWKGGLVIYGGVIGAIVGFLAFAHRHQMPVLSTLDLIAPALVLGLGIGRLGCLLNGCCYGDYCECPWGVTFPAGSNPTMRMVYEGRQSHHGFGAIGDRGRGKVAFVEPDTDADKKGLRPGDEVVLHSESTEAGAIQLQIGERGASRSIIVQPRRSLPLHPTQIYSFLKGIVLFLLLSSLYPHRRRDGEIVTCMVVLYAPARFLIECLRHDELPILAGLTIAQAISVVVFAIGIAGWLAVHRRPIQHRPTSTPTG